VEPQYEDAAYFAYRAQVLRRKLLWQQVFQSPFEVREKLQKTWRRKLLVEVGKWISGLAAWLRKLGSLIFSLFLDVLAGYGYKPGRSLFWYLLMLFGFATAYYILGQTAKPIPLTPLTAFFFSLTSFHGRGFFPESSDHLGDTIVLLAAIEAIMGLFIEVSFVAAFTQRFFGK
jgi:hypothetical protein